MAASQSQGVAGGVASELIRKRRLNSRSDDEIEENIDSRLPYRKGWPILAPLPLETYHGDAASYFPNYEDHLTQIQLLLEIQRVQSKGINVVHRLPLAMNTTDETTATLFITVEGNQGDLFMAVRDIRKYLASQDIHVAIEIMDERAIWIKTHPILPSETEVINRWNTLRDSLTLYLDNRNVAWVSVTVLRRGLALQRDSCPPTIVISARDAANEKWWDDILPSIRNRCQPLLEVELVQEDKASCGPLDDATVAGSYLSMSHLDSRIHMGASCGPAETKGSGTMGAGVRLRKNGQEGIFGISNHRGIKSGILENAVDRNTALSQTHELVSSKSLVVKVPSDRDTILRIENATAAINEHKERVDGTPSALGLQAKVDMGDTSKQKALDKALKDIETNEQHLKILKTFDRTAGHVFASSGYRTAPLGQDRDWALDWSLTRLTSPRTLKNNSKNHMGEKSDFDFWQKVFPQGRQVTKLGRSTGWTMGTVNAIAAVFSKEDTTYKKRVFAWPAVAKFGSQFAIPGDSGSVVYDAEMHYTTGNWIGLLFAANEATGVGYFTPIDVIFDDIAAVTGCEIVDPTPFPTS